MRGLALTGLTLEKKPMLTQGALFLLCAASVSQEEQDRTVAQLIHRSSSGPKNRFSQIESIPRVERR